MEIKSDSFLRDTGRAIRNAGAPAASWLFTAVSLQVFAVCLCVFLAWHGVHHTREGRPTYHFGENRAGTVANVALLAACAAVCGNVARRRLPPENRFWVANAVVFGFLAADDLFRVHENIDRGIHWIFGLNDKNPVTTHLDDLIIVAYGLFTLGVWWRFRRTVLRYPWMFMTMGLAGLGFAGMVTIDVLHGSRVVEESLKLCASAMILAGFLAAQMIPARGAAAPARTARSPEAVTA